MFNEPRIFNIFNIYLSSKISMVKHQPTATRIDDRGMEKGSKPGIVGMLCGHSFVSGLRDHFTHGGKTRVLPTDVARELSISERVRSFHLAGSSGARVIGNAEICKAVQTMRPTYVIIDLGTNDLARVSLLLTIKINAM